MKIKWLTIVVVIALIFIGGLLSLIGTGSVVVAKDFDLGSLRSSSKIPTNMNWSEDFDSYQTGSQMHGQGGWKGWANNGQEYRFQIWAASGSPDTFRIKIWWEDASGEHEAVYAAHGGRGPCDAFTRRGRRNGE